MKVYLCTHDPRLQVELKKHGELEVVHFSMVPETFPLTKEDILVIYDDVADLTQLFQVRKQYPDVQMFYVITLHEDDQSARSIHAACKTQQIRVIPPFRTPEQIAMEILQKQDQKVSRVVAGMAAIYGVGLTTSMLTLGKMLAELCEIKVGVLGLNPFNPGTSHIRYKGKYLDEIWGTLDSQYLQPHELQEKMDQLQTNLYYLAGNRDLIKIYIYNPEGVSYLINLAKQQFDVVLVDVGSYVDNALAYQGILSSDLLLVETNQDRFARENWLRQREQILEKQVGIDFAAARNVWMVCNRMLKYADMETDTQLETLYSLPCIASVPYLDNFYRIQQRSNLLEYNEFSYLSAVRRVAESLIDFYQFPIVEKKVVQAKRKFRLFSREVLSR